MTPNLVLVGLPGCGKSTLGRLVASRCRRRFIDTDAEVERRAGRPVAEIWAAEGEPAFREWEARVVASIVPWEGAVVATGGGVLLREDNRRRLREGGFVVWLRVPLAVLERRTARSAARPLLTGGDRLDVLRALEAQREPLYREAADVVLDLADAHPSVNAAAIAALWEEATAHAPRLAGG
ncbi:MAG: shikimate kinase [Firmicutes bacterium]|nr:shikimate kinase [Bacillota bacterium]